MVDLELRSFSPEVIRGRRFKLDTFNGQEYIINVTLLEESVEVMGVWRILDGGPRKGYDTIEAEEAVYDEFKKRYGVTAVGGVGEGEVEKIKRGAKGETWRQVKVKDWKNGRRGKDRRI
jgi:hypothetical protein